MPMLEVMRSLWPSMLKGSPSRLTILAASAPTALGSVTPSTRMANSSPPNRATRSSCPTASLMRSTTSLSRRSPMAWPSVSFTSLKSSMSR